MKVLSFLTTIICLFISLQFVAQERIELWPNDIPGQNLERMQAGSETRGGVTRLHDVTNPIISVYKPSKEKDNGNSIVVCPGGGYQILAIDLEGSEVAEWLNGLGYTAYVLEYRVPNQKEGALQDVQRAMRVARSLTKESGKVGVLGFSAGGHLSASASTRYSEQIYTAQDKIDKITARPDFTVLIYPAYLDKGENEGLSPEIKLSDETPPMFIFMTADDPYAGSSIAISGALRKNKTPVEFHLLPEGGHGYGLRSGTEAGETWPTMCERWLAKQIK